MSIAVIIFCAMVLLLVAAAVLVSSALLAANRSVVPWQRLKSALGLALWIVPALVILGILAANSQPRFSNRSRQIGSETIQVASVEHNLPRTTFTHAQFDSAIVSWLALTSLLVVGLVGFVACKRTLRLGRRWWSFWRLGMCRLPANHEMKDVVVRAMKSPMVFKTPVHSWQHVALSCTAAAFVLAIAATLVDRIWGLEPRAVLTQFPIGSTSSIDYVHNAAMSKIGLRLTRQQNERIPVEVLKSRQTSTSAPNWPSTATQDQLALQSKLYASIEEAEADVTAQALVRIQERFRDQSGLPGDWPVPVGLVEQHGVKNLVTEVVNYDFGEPAGKAKMYRAHLWLDYSAKLREALFENWRAQLVEQRLISLGSIVALVTLMLGTAAGYFRLDDLTGGQHRGRLKFAAAAVIAAGSLVALIV